MPATIVSTVLIAVLSIAPILTLSAKAQIVCPLPSVIQVTNDLEEDSQRPSVSDDGMLIVFESESNINGGNPNNEDQIYLYNKLTEVITQITFGNNDSTFAKISGDGNKIVFESRADLDGFSSNGKRQVYIYDIPSGVLTQITSNGNFDSRGAQTDFTGSLVAFYSKADLTGQNADNSFEVFLYDVGSATITQITFTTPPEQIFPGGMSADGNIITIEGELASTNFSRQIFYYTRSNGQLTKVTPGNTGNGSNPTINNAGTRMAFSSSQNINGLNPSTRTNAFVFDIPSGEFTNLSNNTQDTSRRVRISGDGLRAVFESSANLTGGSSDGVFQIYVAVIETGQLVQITNGASEDSENGSIDFTGSTVAFQSAANYNGTNPDGADQVYVISCLDPATARNIPTLSEWGLIAMAGVLGIVGFFAVRRRVKFSV